MRILIKQLKHESLIAVDYEHNILENADYNTKVEILLGKRVRVLKPRYQIYPFSGNLFGLQFRDGFITETCYVRRLYNRHVNYFVKELLKKFKNVNSFAIETQYNNVLNFNTENSFKDAIEEFYSNSR